MLKLFIYKQLFELNYQKSNRFLFDYFEIEPKIEPKEFFIFRNHV